MAQLAQAYLHLKPYNVSLRKLKALGKEAESLSSTVAKRIYDGGVVIDVQLEEGSLIVRITVIGLLSSHLALEAYSKIADYKGFKESIVELCNDARSFAIDVCQPFQKKAGASDDQVHRFERRLKTPGRLSRLAGRLGKLESSELSASDLQKELSELRRQLSQIAKDLTPDEVGFVEKHLTTKKLPPPSRWPQPAIPKVAAKNKEEQLEFDEEFGVMAPVFDPVTDKPWLTFRSRINIEKQLPKLDRPMTQDRPLPLRGIDGSHG